MQLVKSIRTTTTLLFQNESEAILKIKESMQEEAKRFEKDSDGGGGGGPPSGQSDFFMP